MSELWNPGTITEQVFSTGVPLCFGVPCHQYLKLRYMDTDSMRIFEVARLRIVRALDAQARSMPATVAGLDRPPHGSHSRSRNRSHSRIFRISLFRLLVD